MWNLILPFFLLLGGVLSSEVKCRYDAHESCRVDDIIPYDMPTNEEELQSACLNLNNTKECITDYEKKICNRDGQSGEDPHRENRGLSEDDLESILKANQRLIDVTTEICQNDSKIHSNFVTDILPCFKTLFDANETEPVCENYSTNAQNYLKSRSNRLEEEEEGDFDRHLECLTPLFNMNCVLDTFAEKCSTRAKDIAIELIKKGGNLDSQCPVSIRPNVLKLLNDLKSETKKDYIFMRQLLEVNTLT